MRGDFVASSFLGRSQREAEAEGGAMDFLGSPQSDVFNEYTIRLSLPATSPSVFSVYLRLAIADMTGSPRTIKNNDVERSRR